MKLEKHDEQIGVDIIRRSLEERMRMIARPAARGVRQRRFRSREDRKDREIARFEGETRTLLAMARLAITFRTFALCAGVAQCATRSYGQFPQS